MKFDFNNIAESYDAHVAAHIPNYNNVIDKSIKICNLYSKNSPIVDFGSANGNTLKKLYNQGFTNLYGVEPVQKMLELSDKSIASYSNALPNIKFDVILANWVLHFIEDKISILQSFYNQLTENGVLILSEKISSNEVIKKFYYEFKISNGLTIDIIKDKEESLKGVMHLFSLAQYMEALNTIGFKTIEIIDGDWGFITLMVKK